MARDGKGWQRRHGREVIAASGGTARTVVVCAIIKLNDVIPYGAVNRQQKPAKACVGVWCQGMAVTLPQVAPGGTCTVPEAASLVCQGEAARTLSRYRQALMPPYRRSDRPVSAAFTVVSRFGHCRRDWRLFRRTVIDLPVPGRGLLLAAGCRRRNLCVKAEAATAFGRTGCGMVAVRHSPGSDRAAAVLDIGLKRGRTHRSRLRY